MGSYTFYTRGVDRIAENLDEFIGNFEAAPSAFDGADALWNTFKENIYQFVVNYSGVAQRPLGEDNEIWRPNWNDVFDIIMETGERSVSDLGCN